MAKHPLGVRGSAGSIPFYKRAKVPQGPDGHNGDLTSTNVNSQITDISSI